MSIPDRNVIDDIRNTQGEEFVEFLQEMNMCVLNGRFVDDNFTCISTKGRSVVDYICVMNDQFTMFKSFRVFTVSEMIDKYALTPLVSDRSRPPDHSLIVVELQVSVGDSLCEQTPSPALNIDTPPNTNAEDTTRQKRKYNVSNISTDFMANAEWRDQLSIIINELLERTNNQCIVDDLYDNMCCKIFEEMDKYIDYRVYSGRKAGKRFKCHKPYWDDHLTSLWKYMCEKEKQYLKFRGSNNEKSSKRLVFQNARNQFDKYLRSRQREYRNKQINIVETACGDNPKQFWEHIKRLGPKKSNSLPEAVKTSHGVSHDKVEILTEWKNSFESLYNPSNINNDQTFYDTAMNEKARLESTFISAEHYDNRTGVINSDITLNETVKILQKLKCNKAVGIDFIPNEVLKGPGIHFVLYKLFAFIFDAGIVPSTWLKAVVNPIPKGSGKDPFVPLNYRGISLLSCISKAYTSLINERISNYCEQHNILVDEQNGFRKGRSCSDHLFTLTSIIRNRLSQKRSTFCAFIDMEKAFDFLDRNLLFYRLLLYQIDGKIYKSIQALYGKTSACVKVNNMFSGWFFTNSGVRQGDSLSPTLFALFINALAEEIKILNKGVDIDGQNISILLYADDIVLISDNEINLQIMLDHMYSWCLKWKLKLNIEKSNVIHFRPKRHIKSEYRFTYGNDTLTIIDKYKYLGVILDEFLNFESCVPSFI